MPQRSTPQLARIVLQAFSTAAIVAACTPAPPSPPAQSNVVPVPTDTTLRNELLRLADEDQVGRADMAAIVASNDTANLFRFMRGDSARTRRLREIVARYGWPSPALIGADGVGAAWLILQHSPDYAWQEQMLPILEKAALAGEIKRSDVAALTDRVLVHAGKPQRYGNSFSMKDGRLVADPIEDLAGLDARRAALGLPPMREYARMLSDAYKIPVEWPPAAR